MLLALLLVIGSACGKKGPPLAPLVRVPARVTDFSARRLGSEVYLRFTVPTANNDGSRPADLDRVEVYGYTGRSSSNEEFLKHGTLVARLNVRRPPPQSGGQPASPPPPVETGFDQGAVAVVSETLTADVMTPSAPEPARPRSTATAPDPSVSMVLGTVLGPPPARTYMAVGVNHRGRRGPLSAQAVVPLVAPPPPPAAPSVSYTETALTVEWTLPVEASPAVGLDEESAVLPSRSLGLALSRRAYNLYDVTPALPPSTSSDAPGPVDQMTPLNEKPIAGPSFEDARLAFGVERCYAVRALSVIGNLRLESEASPPACVTPTDTFPPAPPRSLNAVAGEGAVSLIWEANAEKDLAGYLVLRGEAPGEKLQALTSTPIRETTYRDSTVQSGVRYVYAIIAVDAATPPNLSAHSNRVEEMLR